MVYYRSICEKPSGKIPFVHKKQFMQICTGGIFTLCIIIEAKNVDF